MRTAAAHRLAAAHVAPFPWTALLLAAALPGRAPLRADEVADIETLYRAGDVDRGPAPADATIAAQAAATAQVRFLKGVMLADLKREDEAHAGLHALTQDYPELPDPYNNLAVLYAADGQLQKRAAWRCRRRCATTRAPRRRARTWATCT